MSRHSSPLRQTQLQPASPVEGQDTAPGELLRAGLGAWASSCHYPPPRPGNFSPAGVRRPDIGLHECKPSTGVLEWV